MPEAMASPLSGLAPQACSSIRACVKTDAMAQNRLEFTARLIVLIRHDLGARMDVVVRTARNSPRLSVRPIFVFEYRRTGCAVCNIGRGPALDVLFSRRRQNEAANSAPEDAS